ncbi:MAG: hypothetical protein NTY02_04475 [Acidobacteria bacterium]|nr:hypothetical protein [Acidobacteriota bacterium]
MSKNLAVGVAVLMCLVAAGFGAYLALRPQSTVVSAPEPGVTVASDLTQPAAGTQVPPATGTENIVTDPAPISAPAEATTPVAPAATMGRSVPPATARPAGKPSSKPSQTSQTAPGAAEPPASQAPGWTGVDKPWPSGNATTAATPPTEPPPVSTNTVPEPVAPPPPPPGPPPKQFEELVVSADSVLGLQLESSVSSEVAKVEDPVNAKVTRDVRVGNDLAVPSGTRVLGSVVQVDRGGKMKNAAKLGVRFHTLVMADGTRLPIDTEAIFREGKSPGQESAAKVGAAAVGGAILGAIIGGGKGAAIGGSVGAAGGTAAVMAGGRNPAELKAGTPVTVRLKQPVTVTIERAPQL